MGSNFEDHTLMLKFRDQEIKFFKYFCEFRKAVKNCLVKKTPVKCYCGNIAVTQSHTEALAT